MAREQMREATRLRDRQMLQAAIAAFEQQRLAEQDKDLTNAKRMLNTLIAKESELQIILFNYYYCLISASDFCILLH